MAEVQQNNGGKGKKVKQKKMSLRVDFTPMVDMNMLLITFFMFCTTLNKPQTMEIAMPDKDVKEETEKTKVKPELAFTILLAENDHVYYYEGEPNYEDYTSLKETDFTENGLRKVLLGRNANVVNKVNELKAQKKADQLTEDQFNEEVSKAKGIKEAIVVMIKAQDKATYVNLVDALDEMLICNIGKYAVVDIGEADEFLIQNLLSGGNAAKK